MTSPPVNGALPLAEAAEILNTTAEALRKRIQRGTLAGEKREGQWFVTGLDRPDGLDTPDLASGRASGQEEDASGPASGPPAEASGWRPDSAADLGSRRGSVAAELLQEKDARIADLAATVEAQRQQIEGLQRSEAELRQLLLQAQLQVSALLPKLPAAGGEAQEGRRPWWRWW